MKLLKKIKKRLWGKLVAFFRLKKAYPLIYKSYWHSLLFNKGLNKSANNEKSYYAAQPNYGAGIGHQMANWIAGFWYAKQFELNFAHIPFSSNDWDFFLGFGDGEALFSELIKQDYKKIKLPRFKESNQQEYTLQKNIIDSYRGEKVIFLAESDQYYKDQYGVIGEIQDKFHNSTSRKDNKLIFEPDAYNVAIHVRRGDIVAGQNKVENHTMRWLTNEYFVNVLENTLDCVKTEKKTNIYLFSQGNKEDYVEFENFSNLYYCLDMGAMDSFLHMVYADVLITSKSSFSYKPALLNRGIKVCPEDFWHGYPESDDWWMVDNTGKFIK